jgi:hypothetical protein
MRLNSGETGEAADSYSVGHGMTLHEIAAGKRERLTAADPPPMCLDDLAALSGISRRGGGKWRRRARIHVCVARLHVFLWRSSESRGHWQRGVGGFRQCPSKDGPPTSPLGRAGTLATRNMVLRSIKRKLGGPSCGLTRRTAEARPWFWSPALVNLNRRQQNAALDGLLLDFRR